MEALSLDHFKQQQDYQRSLVLKSKYNKKKSRKHRSHKHRSDRSRKHHHCSHHRSRKTRKDYGSVNDQCAVCLDDETELDTRLFPCKHVFHGQCLIEWVRQGENFTCPLCRQQITHFFNLSNNDEINDQLVSIWNDYYVNIDSEKQDISKVKESDNSNNIRRTSKSLNELTAIVTEDENTVQTASTTSEMDAMSIEETAKLKNKEINESLEIMLAKDELTGLNDKHATQETPLFESEETIDSLSLSPASATMPVISLEKELESLPKAESLPPMAPVEDMAPMQEKQIEASFKTASVWKSLWSQLGHKGKVDSDKSKKSSLKGFIPDAFISLMFDKYLSKSVRSSILEKQESRINENDDRMLYIEDDVGKMANLENYGFELERINDSMRTFDSIPNTTETNATNATQDSNHSVDETKIEVSEVSPVRDKNEDVITNTLTNFESGIYAGIGASIATYLLAHNVRHPLAFALRSNLFPIMRESVPNVAIFFTAYEHLKVYGFDCDTRTKSHTQTFGERFISAGIASSIAFLPRSSSIPSGALKVALPIRFATFFGSFELCKDIATEFKFLHGNYDALNLFEIAGSAAIGSVIASSVHYPISQLIQHRGSLGLAGASASAGATSTTTAFGVGSIFSAGSKGSILETMYRGWLPHLGKFVPPTVACSCAFEFAKRAVNERKD